MTNAIRHSRATMAVFGVLVLSIQALSQTPDKPNLEAIEQGYENALKRASASQVPLIQSNYGVYLIEAGAVDRGLKELAKACGAMKRASSAVNAEAVACFGVYGKNLIDHGRLDEGSQILEQTYMGLYSDGRASKSDRGPLSPQEYMVFRHLNNALFFQRRHERQLVLNQHRLEVLAQLYLGFDMEPDRQYEYLALKHNECIAYHNLGEYDLAIDSCRVVAENLITDDAAELLLKAMAEVDLAVALFNMGRVSEARSALQQAEMTATGLAKLDRHEVLERISGYRAEMSAISAVDAKP